ncbi:MAG: hypothetical protein U9Q07_12905, partial [Planctomycetota bacterium]|nr:hypothetical protein [Planctomycetota bacterium]
MASIFKRKRTVTDADGRKRVKKSLCWYIEFKDQHGKTRRVKAYRDLAATRQKAAELERQAERCDAGLADRYAEHRKLPLSEHLDDFRKSVEVGNTLAYAKITYSRIKTVFDGCGICFWSDISASKIQQYVSGLRKQVTVVDIEEVGKKKVKVKRLKDLGEISAKTKNYYLAAIKMFCS